MANSLDRRLFLLGMAVLAAVPAHAQDVPYVPTPAEVVEGMLDMAGLKAGERLIDLGSGDGRIPIAAARRGATALGVEIDARLVTRARSLAQFAGQDGRAKFLRADLFTVSLRDADVVTLYLLPKVNARLRPKLLTELRPGTRVVSHAFDMGDWVADAARTVGDSNLYFWTIPAVAGGEWVLSRSDGSRASLVIDQRYSRVSGTLDGRALEQASLKGTALTFTLDGKTYRGSVGERAITGEGWTATRVE